MPSAETLIPLVPPHDPNAARLPDATSALIGPLPSLHNRVQTLILFGELEAASSHARHVVFSSIRPTIFTCNAIMASMHRARRLDDVVALFHFFYVQQNILPNIVSYNVLINTYCDANRVATALEVYRHILANAPFSPSPVTYRHLTKGLIDAGRITEAIDLLHKILSRGHGADSLVYSNLMYGFINLGNMDKALELLDELRERCPIYDGVVHATLMEAYWKQGMDKEAMDSYQSLIDRQFKMTPVTCNVTLLELYNKAFDGLVRVGHLGQAMDIFGKLVEREIKRNALSYEILVTGLCKEGDLNRAHSLLEEMVKGGIRANDELQSLETFQMAGRGEEIELLLCGKRSAILETASFQEIIPNIASEPAINQQVAASS
ncbi:Pentatricopeptide repeat-containing protein [Platanthera zijinensis]|uniref:Pentatricopeptide repeat-containing protein n=1 Tax=Platanthera zijinensis TaxID=2320716 RepID=A0AAP0BHM4_9ASPA